MIEFLEVSKKYPNGTIAIQDVSMHVPDGEFVFLIGPSGAGKSTILKLLIREESPSSGKILVDEFDLGKLSFDKLPHLRRKVGLIFQDFKLLPSMTVWENIAFALFTRGLPDKEIAESVDEVLATVNLSDKAKNFPHQLSGGEAQRVAVARAVVGKPSVLLADEPTGNLDGKSAWEVMQILQKINDAGTTVIMATHNADIVRTLPHRVVTIERGKLTADHPTRKPKEAGKDK
ncbi:MAG TPA: cell division ATP-binding protein FtsE [Patescibacteria group bacterium]|nr:cell division ATP-binding protein FtsE [Patescibacteria group bacterium]